jgi:CDP-6-deoxy-D-xylo-4-hexulose-3-dehydrase
MAVSILGNPAALDVMRKLCDRHGLYLFEDNCESMDAELVGKKAGTFGEVNTFSFFFSHHISTMEGGMILTDDVEIAHLCRSMRAHGWTRDLPKDSPLFERRSSDHFEAYRFILPGYNVRPLEMSGAIGREQLKKLPGFTAKRRANLAVFQRLFGGDNRFITPRENGKSSSFCFPIVLNPDGNFLRHDVINYYDYEIHGGAAPNADTAHDYGFFVGNHPFDLSDRIEKLYRVLDKSCGAA